MPQNKFEVLRSRVMQCGVEEKMIRSMRMAVVRCFKCREEGHKCRECPLWVKKERLACVARPQKAQQEKRPACPVRGEAQEKKLRRVEENGAAHPMKGKAQQEEWKRSSWKVLSERAEWYCGPTVPQDAQLWELGWRGQGAVVTYLKCPRCGKGGCYVEDDWGQGTLPYLLEEGEDKLVWMQGEESGKWCTHREEKRSKGRTERRTSRRLEKRSERGESGAAQRGKGAAERRMVKRTGKHSKRGG